eukprot:TCONS_00031414-protein
MRRQTKRFFVFILIIAMLLFAVIHNLTLKITGKDLVTTFFDNPWLEERKYLIQEYSKDRSNVVNLKSVCPVPDLNPFSKDVIHLMKKVSGKCTLKRYGKIIDKNFILEGRIFHEVKLQYLRRAPKKGEISDDFAITLSEKIDVPKIGKDKYMLELKEDHIKVTMKLYFTQHHTEYHSHVNKFSDQLRPLHELKSSDTGLPINIAIQMYDSQSRANFQRHAIKTMDFLEKDVDSFIFQSNSIVGDGTTAQISAMLTGVAEKDQYETRRGFPNTRTVDDFEWIFKYFHNAGYATMYSEDDMDFGTFNYRLNGFAKPPALWYPKPMWLGWVQDYNHKHLCGAEQNIGLLKQFDEMFRYYGRFAFALTAKFCHDDPNTLQLMDQQTLDLIKYYKKEDNTIFILFGDHGSRAGKLRETLQGKLEERIPFLAMVVPSWLKVKHPEIHSALRYNTRAFTTYFDINAMFRHIVSYPKLPGPEVKGRSLFTRLPLNRTCASEGVEEHWCPCLTYKRISTTDENVNKIAQELIKFINKLYSHLNKERQTCATLKLDHIESAGLSTPNEKVQRFKNTKRDHVCDSCGVVLDSSMDIKQDKLAIKSYQLVFMVKPSGGKFEANAKMDSSGKITVDPLISRINMYRDQPKCIAATHPHLRPYCYCV